MIFVQWLASSDAIRSDFGEPHDVKVMGQTKSHSINAFHGAER